MFNNFKKLLIAIGIVLGGFGGIFGLIYLIATQELAGQLIVLVLLLALFIYLVFLAIK